MLLKTDKITVEIEDFVARSHRVPGILSQFMLDPTALVGWYDGVDTRRDAAARPTSDGDFMDYARKASRVISISGFAEAESVEQLHAMRDQFTTILNHGGFSELAVQDGAGTRYALVGISGKPSWIPQTDLFASWKIDMYSPNPEIYGPEKVAYLPGTNLSGGLGYPLVYPLEYSAPLKYESTFVDNLGNTPSWPIFKITGNYMAGFALTDNKGNQVIYRGPVSTSSPVIIDMGSGAAIQDGVEKSYNLDDRDWFSIEPGESIQPGFIPLDLGSGWCDIIYRDTWI